MTRHACFYDGTRGTEGRAAGLPIGLEGRGKVRACNAGLGLIRANRAQINLLAQNLTLGPQAATLCFAGALRAAR